MGLCLLSELPHGPEISYLLRLSVCISWSLFLVPLLGNASVEEHLCFRNYYQGIVACTMLPKSYDARNGLSKNQPRSLCQTAGVLYRRPGLRLETAWLR